MLLNVFMLHDACIRIPQSKAQLFTCAGFMTYPVLSIHMTKYFHWGGVVYTTIWWSAVILLSTCFLTSCVAVVNPYFLLNPNFDFKSVDIYFGGVPPNQILLLCDSNGTHTYLMSFALVCTLDRCTPPTSPA